MDDPHDMMDNFTRHRSQDANADGAYFVLELLPALTIVSVLPCQTTLLSFLHKLSFVGKQEPFTGMQSTRVKQNMVSVMSFEKT